MRKLSLLAVLALFAGAAISACGGSLRGGLDTRSVTTAPITFTETVTTPTATYPTTTSVPYIGPQEVPIEVGRFLAPAVTTHLGTIVHGIQCEPTQQLAYRTYVHLQVYVNGRPRALPGGIGMVDPSGSVTQNGLVYSAQTCYYWLHTRAADGVILVESPNSRRFDLGDFFAIWNQPLSARRVAGASGRVTAIVNGRPWTKSPRLIPLRQHTQIELAVGKPVPAFSPIDWSVTNF